MNEHDIDTGVQPADFREDWLSAYLDDELPPTERTIVEQRLAADPVARATLNDLQQIRSLVGSLPAWSDPTPAFDLDSARGDRISGHDAVSSSSPTVSSDPRDSLDTADSSPNVDGAMEETASDADDETSVPRMVLTGSGPTSFEDELELQISLDAERLDALEAAEHKLGQDELDKGQLDKGELGPNELHQNEVSTGVVQVEQNTTSMRWLRPVAMAASVLLAVGIGWMLWPDSGERQLAQGDARDGQTGSAAVQAMPEPAAGTAEEPMQGQPMPKAARQSLPFNARGADAANSGEADAMGSAFLMREPESLGDEQSRSQSADGAAAKSLPRDVVPRKESSLPGASSLQAAPTAPETAAVPGVASSEADENNIASSEIARNDLERQADANITPDRESTSKLGYGGAAFGGGGMGGVEGGGYGGESGSIAAADSFNPIETPRQLEPPAVEAETTQPEALARELARRQLGIANARPLRVLRTAVWTEEAVKANLPTLAGLLGIKPGDELRNAAENADVRRSAPPPLAVVSLTGESKVLAAIERQLSSGRIVPTGRFSVAERDVQTPEATQERKGDSADEAGFAEADSQPPQEKAELPPPGRALSESALPNRRSSSPPATPARQPTVSRSEATALFLSRGEAEQLLGVLSQERAAAEPFESQVIWFSPAGSSRESPASPSGSAESEPVVVLLQTDDK